MPTFNILTQDEQDNIVVDFHAAQERDLFTHTINLARYQSMLGTLPDTPFKNRIQQLHDETVSRLEEVNAIIVATKPQLPTPTKIQSILAARVAAPAVTPPTVTPL